MRRWHRCLSLLVLSFLVGIVFYGSVLAVDDTTPGGGGDGGGVSVMSSCPEGAVLAVLVRSWGTVGSSSLIFSDLNANWANYGSTPICIFDYGSGAITYDGLVATGADVVIISDAAGGGEQYSSSEISAIDAYARAGHNVIGTYALYQWYSDDNRGLLATFGHESTLSFINTVETSCSLAFNVLDTSDPLFRAIGATYASSGYASCQVPTDGTWDGSDLVGAQFVAKAADNKAVITIYSGPGYVAIYISSMPEYGGGTQDKQWFYNAITYGKAPCAPVPVGGTVTVPSPATIAVVLPWLAAIGLVGCIGTAVVVAKRRR